MICTFVCSWLALYCDDILGVGCIQRAAFCFGTGSIWWFNLFIQISFELHQMFILQSMFLICLYMRSEYCFLPGSALRRQGTFESTRSTLLNLYFSEHSILINQSDLLNQPSSLIKSGDTHWDSWMSGNEIRVKYMSGTLKLYLDAGFFSLELGIGEAMIMLLLNRLCNR